MVPKVLSQVFLHFCQIFGTFHDDYSKWSVSHQWLLFRVSNASLVNIRQTIANENGDTSQCARISKIVLTYIHTTNFKCPG